MPKTIKVAILDDHQSIIDGYVYRLSQTPEIEVVATLGFGEELEPALEKDPPDVLMLDVNVPTSPTNPNSYPILYLIPKLFQDYPAINIVVISMFAERGMIRAVMETGVSGYILKDDQATIRDLGNVVLAIANGGIYFSQKAHQLFMRHQPAQSEPMLSTRQIEALSLCASYPNYSMMELAQKMMVSNSTIRNLLSGAYVKLGVHTRTGAIAKAHQLGIITSLSPTRPL